MSTNTKILITVVILIVVSGYAWIFLANKSLEEPMVNNSIVNTNITQQVNTNVTVEMLYRFTGLLADVSGGSGLGEAKANFENGQYDLLATFENLPDPEGTDFYEGWIVRSDPQSVLSTGVAVKDSGIYKNTYTADQDLTDHDYYVLTLEPDDGDPAPATHILEGLLSI